MRFVIMRKADAVTESGAPPSEELLAAMGKYADDLEQAGVLLGGELLRPSANGARLRVANGKTSIVDGPFTEAKEVIAGFVMIEVNSLEEAIAWAKRCPSLYSNDAEMEIRQVAEATDFPMEQWPDLARLPWSSIAKQAEEQLQVKK